MPFADSPDILWQTLIGAAVTVVLAWMQVWTKVRLESLAREARAEASAAKTAAIITDRSVAGKFDQVQDALRKKGEATAQFRSDVKDAVEQNTAMIAETKSMVNGQREAMIAEIAALKAALEAAKAATRSRRSTDGPPPPQEPS